MPWPLLILFSLPWLTSPQNLVKVKLFRNWQQSLILVPSCFDPRILLLSVTPRNMTLHLFLLSLRSPSRPHLLVLIYWVRSSPLPSPSELATPPLSTSQPSVMPTPWTPASRLVAQPLPAAPPSSKLEQTAPCVGGRAAWRTDYACQHLNSRKRAMG